MGNDYYARNENPTDSSPDFLRTESSRMHKIKSLPGLQSKDKESSLSYIGVESSRFSTEVDYTTTIDTKPTKDEWNNMSNAEKFVSVIIEGFKY